jgi:hypothetical protein
VDINFECTVSIFNECNNKKLFNEGEVCTNQVFRGSIKYEPLWVGDLDYDFFSNNQSKSLITF